MAGARFHPKYSYSNGHRLMNCAGQVALCANLPDIETEHTINGTFAHLVLEAAINNGVSDTSYMVGLFSIDSRWVDQETADAVQVCVDYVNALKIEYPDLRVKAESPSNFPGYRFEFSGGTADIVWWSAAARQAGVIDYKHGAGDRIDADDNKQLAGCLWGEFMPSGYELTGTIIQPRHWAYQGPREAKFFWPDLFDFSRDWDAAITAAEKPGAELSPGTWCTNCKAAALCPALEQAVAALQPPTDFTKPENLDTLRLAKIVGGTAMGRAWFKACEEFAERQALQGTHIPGYKIVAGRKQRRYRPDMPPDYIARDVSQLTGGRVSEAQLMPPRLKSLTEVEKLLVATFRDAVPPDQRDAAAEQARAKFAFFTLRDEGTTLTLAPETDPRPAYRPALDDFAGVTINHIP